MRFLSWLADMFLLSFLTILFSIPILTLSTSMIAASRVAQDMIHGEGGKVIKTFLAHYMKNLKQGILCSLITCIGIVIFAYDIFWLTSNQSAPSLVLVTLLVIVSILFTATLIRLHVLIARYNNSLRQHLFNAFVFSCWHFIRSIFVSAIAFLPGILLIFFPDYFFLLLPVWILFFPGVSIYLFNRILEPSFQQIEDINSKNRTDPT